MTMTREAAGSRTSAAARLFASAQEIVLQRGLAGASARAIAHHAGSSASAIHYHFENVERLVWAALDDARERDSTWRRALLDELSRAQLAPVLFPFFLQGVIETAGTSHRHLTLLHWDVALAAILQKRCIDIAAAWRDDVIAFWSAALNAFDITASARLVGEFADAASRLYLAAGHGPTHIAWITETIMYFAERLCGRPQKRRTANLWRDFHRSTVQSPIAIDPQNARGPTAARIVEGALHIVLTQGTHALTHRAVASAAGVSLSSTTYHFASRGEILHAAFSQLRANTLARVATLTPVKQRKSMTLENLVELMGAVLVPSSGEVSREYVAAQSLLHAAARDAALRSHAQELFANMGEATWALFRRTRGLREKSDALSTFIFALWTDAMLCNAGLESAALVARHVRAQQRAMISLLYAGSSYVED